MYVLDPAMVYVAYSWDGYEDDCYICKVFPTEQMAKEYCRQKNKEECADYTNGTNRYISTDGDVDFSETDSDDFYYWYAGVPLATPGGNNGNN